ncbi:MAG: hypothetical protein HY644_04455 [Acidobacteria bacterium]|nr:hypothetical protein [Acidobacteriota bacterium]
MKKRYRSAQEVDGIIDLERLQSGPQGCIERNPRLFFELSYPSEDLRGMLQAVSRRFTQRSSEEPGPGLYLAEAVKGFGKSHVLLIGHYLFAEPDCAASWMKGLGYPWKPVSDLVAVWQKFTDRSLPFDSLWTLLGQRLDVNWLKDRPPNLDEFRSALGKRHLILVFDELERGISNIADPARRSQNLSFLQMISEEANRSNRITMFAAIYDGNVEPGSTLKRVPRVELRFRKAEDRTAIVRHRLFLDADSYDRGSADALIRSYVNAWRRMGVETSDDYLSRLRKSYPFLPELIELIFDRITTSQGFQGTRGALGLLAAMVDVADVESSILTAAHCKLTDRRCADRLQDLDPAGSLINCATNNLRDLNTLPNAKSLASAVLLASLAPGGKTRGLSREELVRHVAAPGCDPNQFEATLQAFRTLGSYFHEKEARFFFDLEENEYAKVELGARRLSDDAAREEIRKIWLQELFRETQQAVIFSDPSTTRASLDALGKSSPRYVLSPRRLSAIERHSLYFGMELRNQILLFEPREDTANHLANADLLAYAKRARAADDLVSAAATAERRKRYESIATKERKDLRDFLKSAGLVYIRVEKWAERPEESVFEQEPLGQSSSKDEILQLLRTKIYPPQFIQEHIASGLNSLLGQTVDNVDRLYRNTLGFPVPLTLTAISDSIREMAEDPQRMLGLQHTRGNSCGERVLLGVAELREVVLTPPWSAATSGPPTVATKPGTAPAESKPVEFPGRASVLTSAPLEERSTRACASRAELRQEIAARLTDLTGLIIQRIKFQIFADYRTVDLSSYPSPLRGALTGTGDLEVQLTITCPGPIDKARAESCCESLPNFSHASYTARLWIEVPAGVESAEGQYLEETM